MKENLQWTNYPSEPGWYVSRRKAGGKQWLVKLEAREGGGLRVLTELRKDTVDPRLEWLGPFAPSADQVRKFVNLRPARRKQEMSALVVAGVNTSAPPLPAWVTLEKPPEWPDEVVTLTQGALPPMLEAPGVTVGNLNGVTKATFDIGPSELAFEVVTKIPRQGGLSAAFAAAYGQTVDADTCELIPLDDQPGTKFPVNARDLHQYLGIGRKFATWITDRIEKFELVEGETYEVCFPDLGSKECGADSNKRGGHNAKEYRLTLTSAQWLAADHGSEKGRKVIKYLTACTEKFTAMQQAPAIDFGDPLVAARLYIDTEEARRKAVLHLESTERELEVKAEEVHALEHAVEAERTAAEQEIDRLMARIDAPDKTVSPTEFFKLTASILGYSQDEGFDYLVSSGIFSKPVKNKWKTNQYSPNSPHDKNGNFQPVRIRNNRSVYDEDGVTKLARTEREEVVTYHLTQDKYDRLGRFVRPGGFRWLLSKMMKDWRTQLNRMLAETGGASGPFGKLYKCVIVQVKDYDIPYVDLYEFRCIVMARKKGSVAVAHKVSRGVIHRAEGATLREAIENLNAKL